MSYTVLARRYRSGNFDEVVGQAHIAQTLKKAIESGRIAHAYLFCGTRGTGKTSTARILAKALNCEKFDKPTTEPCGKCESCLAIARGDDIDVIEIDAASNTGVDNVRDLIANSQFHPARSRFKVYIIDEVHMLSKSAFNALLKTLEEPPSHVKFILATTEPEKVLPTILSRCQRYDFRNIPTREIADHLKDVCKKEKIKADEDALLMIAKAGAGSMRDALSLLDRLLSVGEKSLTTEMIEQLLGLPKTQLVFDLAQSIGSGDVKSVLTKVETITAQGLSVDTLIGSLVDHLRNLLILRTCGPDTNLVEAPGLSIEQLVEQANQFEPAVLTQDITILEELRRQIRVSQAGRALLDATLVRLALADQFSSIGQLLTGGNGAGPRPAAAANIQKKKFEPVTVASRTVISPPTVAANARVAVESPVSEAATASATAVAPAVVEEDDDLPRPGKVWDSSGPSLKELLAQQQSSSPTPAQAKDAPQINVEPVSDVEFSGRWKVLLEKISGAMGIHGILSQGRLVGIEDNRAIIALAPQHEFWVKKFDQNSKKEMVRSAVAETFGEGIGVSFRIDRSADVVTAPMPATAPRTIESSAPASPMVRATPPRVERFAPRAAPEPMAAPAGPPPVRITPELVESLRQSEPLVKALMDELGAQIVKIEES